MAGTSKKAAKIKGLISIQGKTIRNATLGTHTHTEAYAGIMQNSIVYLFLFSYSEILKSMDIF